MLPPSSPVTVARSGSPLTVARPCRIPTGFPRTRTVVRFRRPGGRVLVRAEGRGVITLVLGPVRSGKSTRASALARASGKRVVLAVTADVDPADPEMTDRVARHRAARPAEWAVVETAGPAGPALPALLRATPADACVLVDALGTWLGALVQRLGPSAEHDALATLAALDAAGDELAAALAATRADVVLVGEEAGWGVVPASVLGRVFRDALGRLVARLAARADRVELVVAGYAVDLRALGTRVADEG